MTRFRDWPPWGSWKTGYQRTRYVGRDQVTRPLTCYCTRTSVIEEGKRIGACLTYNGTFSKAFMGISPTVRRTRCEAAIYRA
jgi:predicted ester cyclase